MADRQYELVYILPPETTEEQVNELHGQVDAIVSRMNGRIEKTENWGRRRLAYEIAHHKDGVYVLEVINGSGDLMKEVDRRLRVMDQVVRHLHFGAVVAALQVQNQKSKRRVVIDALDERHRVAVQGSHEPGGVPGVGPQQEFIGLTGAVDQQPSTCLIILETDFADLPASPRARGVSRDGEGGQRAG